MTPSNVDPIKDYADLVACLNAHDVRYVVIGAYAVGHYGYVRGTSDLDILVSSATENAERLSAALRKFAGVEILTTMKGATWERAWNERQQGRLGDQTANFLSYECLLDVKRACGRHKDLADIEGLQKSS